MFACKEATSNFCLKELVERLAAAVDLEGVFSRHRHLERGHCRLKVSQTEHTDHLNPESWMGHVTANRVDLSSAWCNGQLAAAATLAHLRLSVDFDELFDKDRTTDLMKPFGNGRYPGVSTEPDRSQELAVSATAEASALLQPIPNAIANLNNPMDSYELFYSTNDTAIAQVSSSESRSGFRGDGKREWATAGVASAYVLRLPDSQPGISYKGRPGTEPESGSE